MTVNGLDVSRYQPPDRIDYQAIWDAGHRYAAIRCTVGDYYSDPEFPIHWDRFGNVGFYRMPYIVVAPAVWTGSSWRQINVTQHVNRFLAHWGDRESELPWVLDCELTRGQSRDYITDLMEGMVENFTVRLGREPIIYTRQTWWDFYVNARLLWGTCPLWAARYSNVLTSPWSDGYYRFRDWSNWVFWQWTSHGRSPGYDSDLDLDRFNGNDTDLATFAGNISRETMLNILWREAANHNWNLVP